MVNVGIYLVMVDALGRSNVWKWEHYEIAFGGRRVSNLAENSFARVDTPWHFGAAQVGQQPQTHTNPITAMDELIKLVADKTGIPADTAKTAVTTVIGFLKDKLPAPLASQLDGLTGTSGGDKEGGDGGNILDSVGKMFG